MAAGPKRPSMHESMYWTNVSGFLVALVLGIVSGHLGPPPARCCSSPPLPLHAPPRRTLGSPWTLMSCVPVGGIKFCAAHPSILYAIIIYSLSSAVGGNFVYFTLTQFNPLVLTTVSTLLFLNS